MSGGDEQGFDVRYREPPPFGRQSSAPVFGQSGNGHTTTSLGDSPTVSFSPQAQASTTYSPLPSGFVRPHSLSTSTNHLSGDQLEDRRGRESPDPADYYRQRGSLPGTSSNVREGFGDVRTGMAAADYSSVGDKASPLPTNTLESSRARHQPYCTTSDSPTLGAPSANIPPLHANARARQPSFKDLVNKFNKTSDQVLPLPSVSRSTSRAPSPSGSVDGERNQVLPRTRQHRDSLPESINSNPPASVVSNPSSPETDRFAPPLDTKSAIPPPLFQRITESHPRRQLFGELLPINTQLNNGVISRLQQRRGSDGSIPSPNPTFLEHRDQHPAKTPLTPTSWYLGHTPSLEAVHVGIHNTAKHRRVRSDLEKKREPLAEPWNPKMAVPAPLLRTKPDHGSPPGSPNSKSRIPVSSHRLATASGPESLSPSSNPTFRSRSAAITSPPKGSSRLPIPSPKQSPPRMPADDPASVATTSRGSRDLTIGRTRNQLSESSRRLQAYIAEPPSKKSPPLRSSRPRQPVSHGAAVSPRSKIGDRVLNLQKHVTHSDSRSRSERKLPELGKVDFDARRRHIQQAINRHSVVQENKNDRGPDKLAAAKLRRHAFVLEQKTHRDFKQLMDEPAITPNLPVTNAPSSDEMATMVNESVGSVNYKENRVQAVPRLHLNTTLPASDMAAPHTTMDSPTLGLPQDVKTTASVEGQSANEDATHSGATSDSGGTHVTIFDPEPQSALLQRDPSASHRTILEQIMQIRGSSPSDDSCDEPDCSLSDNDDRESIQIMLGDTAYYNSSSSTNTQEPERTPMHQVQNETHLHNRWSLRSWSSGQNQHSICDEQCDESGDDSLLRDHETEPPTENCSVVSTRPASIADDESPAPIQDHGVMGPNTLQSSEMFRSNAFSTPPSLARLGRWDSKRVTQLYLEELTRGRSHHHGSSIHPSSEPQYHPSETRTDGRPDSLTDDPVVVPRFKDFYASDRLSHTASLVGRDDWEHASPSIMDWMQIAAEDDDLTPNTEIDGVRTAGVLTPRLVLSTFHDADASSTNSGLGVSVDVQAFNEQLQPHVFPSSAFIPPSITHPIGNGPLGGQLWGYGGLCSSKQAAPRAAKHSPGSSQDSSFQNLESIQSTVAADSSATSLVPSTEQTNRVEQKGSPSPEQRRLKKRRHIIKELVDTEHTFGHDMIIIEDIYKRTSLTVLEPDDVKVLFGNSDQVAAFSDKFLYDLKQAAQSIYIIPKALRWTSKRKRNNHATESKTPELDEGTELAAISELEKDGETSVGQVFVNHMTHMEKVYTDYLKNHDAANKRLQVVQRNSKVGFWLSECQKGALDLTTAWDLDSLLVKPVQRILKYPLILRDLLECTPNDHPDRAAIANALEEVTNVSHRINELKKRVDLVGQAVGRKRNQSDVRTGLSKAFGRRTEKFRQQVGLSDLFEDKTYDLLAQKLSDGYFQLQVVMRDAESYSRDVQLYLNQFNEYADSIEDIIGMSPSPYPQLESKWYRFKMTVQDLVSTDLPEHLTVVRKTVIDPMVELLGLYNAPQRVMRKRDKRLPEYARYKAIKDRGDKPDKKTIEQGEQFLALNDTLKDELPKLYALTSKLMAACLKNFIGIQTAWYGVLQKKIGAHVELFPNDLDRLISDFNSDHALMEARMGELSSCNGAMMTHSLNLVSLSPSEQQNPISPRRPSTVNSSNARPGSLSEGSPKVSRDFSVGSHSFQSPQMESHSSRSSCYRADSILSGRMVSETPSQLLQQVTSSPTPARTSDVESFPSLPRLSLDTPFLEDVINSSSHSSSLLAFPTDRYSGFFSSAMPMSDVPSDTVVSGHFERSRPPMGPAALFCAASVCKFDIDTRTEGGYPYLTYASGDIFDIVGEKGELWLARNQDDATRTVGWIWNKHFARLSS
ncbi:Rho guanyl nucleotide exchange factor, putative [Penicillium digitatum PHI26]|uniref:Rho guanyl nucleotide exchange factor, putative n=3 Tax=Penicillium digitatum TaxID=36651 RepID=K9FT32_PEND2|nr:Rho guanyl nucleotide exchange factor, putative [Penicillium digitatum Pd1]EKV10806.1 Rho guanyl nucleotide exchange factor, putative [Penicillium digitatum Pd1]EKV11682.1 Rho guanyl nucleotide exchange factor, putative [Penicillium digitatum PHI26]